MFPSTRNARSLSLLGLCHCVLRSSAMLLSGEAGPQLEASICKQLSIPSIRPFQRSVLRRLGVLPCTQPPCDVLAVQPTGAGKSVCFQAAGLVLPGPTLVVTPLIALMADQLQSLSEAGVRSASINSMQGASERSATLRSLQAGEVDLLYVSPEQLDLNSKRVQHQAPDEDAVSCCFDDGDCSSRKHWERMTSLPLLSVRGSYAFTTGECNIFGGTCRVCRVRDGGCGGR